MVREAESLWGLVQDMIQRVAGLAFQCNFITPVKVRAYLDLQLSMGNRCLKSHTSLQHSRSHQVFESYDTARFEPKIERSYKNVTTVTQLSMIFQM